MSSPGAWAQGPPPPPNQWPRQPAAPVTSPVGLLVTLLGLGTAAAGLFALPLNTYSGRGDDIGFVQIRSTAALYQGATRASSRGGGLFSDLAAFWWRFGALITPALALVLLGVLLLRPATRWLGWVVAVLGVAGGVLTGLAMAQSADYRTAVQQFRGYGFSDMFDHPGPGVFVSLAGFAVLAVGGVLVGLLRTRRAG